MGVLSDRQIKAGVKITPFVDGQKRDGVISYGLTSYGYDVRAGYKFQIFTDVNCSVIDPKAFDKQMLVDVDLTPRNGHDFSGGGPDPTCNRCGVYASNPYKDGVQWRGRCREYTPNHILIPPNSFALAETVEHLEIPRDTLAIVLGKSTYARCGLVVNCTPLEPEWRGKVTMELSNTTPLPIKVYAGEGIAQVYFLRSDEKRDQLELIVKEIARYVWMNNQMVMLPDLQGGRSSNGNVLSTIRGLLEAAGCQVSYADKKGRYQDQAGLTHPFVDKGE